MTEVLDEASRALLENTVKALGGTEHARNCVMVAYNLGAVRCERLEKALADLLNTTFIKDQQKYLDRGIGTFTGGGKAIIEARAALAEQGVRA